MMLYAIKHGIMIWVSQFGAIHVSREINHLLWDLGVISNGKVTSVNQSLVIPSRAMV